MGDPMTKGLLTLFSLAANALAQVETQPDNVWDPFDPDFAYEGMDYEQFATYVVTTRRGWHADVTAREEGNAPATPSPVRKRFSRDWEKPNIFSTAGDDVGALGPLRKLRRIRANLESWGLKVSEEKFFISPTGMIYCERLALRTLSNQMSRPLDGEYHGHLMVDSLKVRLLSPESKAQETSNNGNPAIGKSKALARSVDQLPPGWSAMRTATWRRFKQRMSRHLPRLTNGLLDPVVNLPSKLGGMGLAEVAIAPLSDAVANMSQLHKAFVNAIIDGDYDPRLQRSLISFTKDRFGRGMVQNDNVIDDLFDDLALSLSPTPIGVSGTLLRENIPTSGLLGYQAKREELTKRGFIGSNELRELYRRSALQTKLVLEKPDAGWSDAGWPKRRIAFESVLAKVSIIRIAEGRPLPPPPEDGVLAGKILVFCNNGMPGLFNEEVFFHRSMTINMIGHDEDHVPFVYKIASPIEDLLNSIPTLEVKAINRWFNAPEK